MKDERLTQIVKEVQKDIEQFELLYSYVIKKVYFWCYTIIGNEADARDMSQEVMIRIYKNIHSLKSPEAFTSWMYRLARNSCLTYIRNHKKTDVEFLYNDNYEESFEANIKEERIYRLPKESYDLQQTKDVVKKLIEKLPRKQKEAITLHYLDELKIEEIANILECPVGSVKSRLHDGRKKLQEKISNYQEENNVKLYSITLLPLLALILEEHREELGQRQDLTYDKNNFISNKLVRILNSISSISNYMLYITISMVCIVSILVVIMTQENMIKKQDSKAYDEIGENDNIMYNKSKGYQYIESVYYPQFPRRDGVEIKVKLQQNVKTKDIKVALNDEEIIFFEKDNNIMIDVNKNGNLIIQVKNEQVSVNVNSIDEQAPELLEVHSYETYLELITDDEFHQIDYEKSYVEYNGKQFQINYQNQVNGSFKGNISVVMFNQNNQYIKYEVFIK